MSWDIGDHGDRWHVGCNGGDQPKIWDKVEARAIIVERIMASPDATGTTMANGTCRVRRALREGGDWRW